jgi:Ca2+-binding EF-hand superfamily protein
MITAATLASTQFIAPSNRSISMKRSFVTIMTFLLLTGYSLIYAHEIDAEAVEQHFSEIDQTNDGYISEEEARRAGITDEDFNEMDLDGDRRISEQEFHQFHGTYGEYDEDMMD